MTANVKVGSVLTYYNGHWGTILSYSGWSDNHIQIICRQLGYHSSTGNFSPCLSCGHVPCSTKLPIFLWKIDSTCIGNEEVITECDTSDWLATRTCTAPYTTAGVHCSGTVAITQANNHIIEVAIMVTFIYTVPVQGGWSPWSISSCSSNCFGGIRQYRRACTNPPPQNGGEFCMGRFSFDESCGSLDCGKSFNYEYYTMVEY